MNKTTDKSSHNCSVCNGCNVHRHSRNTLQGFRLMLCAFIVFVMPLIFGVISGNIVYIYYDKPGFVIVVSCVITGILTGILLAKLTIRLIINDSGKDKSGT